ncbi:hypothetical protein F183_A31210 [Bryobacterales bacterium F-183]|nr:hypothetical protein F183_A31210 [Bryobacterales bacterium F-183]
MELQAHILDLDNQERLAALQRDAAALHALWSDDFTVNAPNSAVVQGKAAVLETFVSSGVIDFASFDRAYEYVRLDGSFAFLMGLETLMPNVDAPSAGLKAGQLVRRRFTNIWKQEADGQWRLYARHANVIPSK